MRAIYAKAGLTAGFGIDQGRLVERMEVLGKLPLVHQPGERWTYGLNMDVLGAVVEIVSGKSLDAFLSERVFRPLGMKDTYFNVPAEKAGRLVTVYMEDSVHQVVKWTKERRGVDVDYPLHVKHYFSGGADLTSTAYDYAVFLQMLLNKGEYNGVRILAPRTVEIMTSNQLGRLYNDQNGFGLGFEVTGSPRGPRNEGSFSWGGFFGTTYWVDPKAKLVCLFMTQQQPNSHGELSRLFEQIVYSSLR
jgi:CubicO group peptidase (beta-lactamase class C family)